MAGAPPWRRKFRSLGDHMKFKPILSVVAVLLLLSAAAAAQTFRATIVGDVTDATGAVVPGAKVTIRNLNTGLERITATDSTGSFSAPELPFGIYRVVVEKQGFQTAAATDVRVDVAGERKINFVLRPGQVEQTTEVRAEAPLIESTTNVLGGVFESREVVDLPINGRDFTKLLIMVPGAAGEPNGGGDSPGSFGLFSVNGNRGRSNNFLLDGTDMNDGYRNLPSINQGGVFGTPGTVLPIEAIAELRVLSNFESEFGRNSGSVVNIVTKSGTNDVHGSVFEYFRHDKLNARNFFNTQASKDKFRNNQFGASIGGPLKKNKAFWYAAYEGQRERVGIASVNTVPTPADFADAITTLGGNPSVPVASNPVVNPVIRNLFALCATNGNCSGGNDVWPAPNLAGTPNSVSSAAAFNNANSVIAKIDYNVNDRNHLTGRYFFGDSDQSFPLGLAGGNNLPNTNTDSPIRAQLVSLSYVHVPSTTKVNEARFGWNLYSQDFLAQDAKVFGNPNTTLKLNNGVTRPRDFGLPTIRVSGFASLGSSGFSNPRGRDDTNWHFIDNFSSKMGAHDVKLGYEFRRTAVDSFNDFNFRGRISFGSLADFLAGDPTGFSLIPAGNTDREARQNSHALYVQDSIRTTSELTLNLGLRWEYFGVIHETKNRFSTYNPSTGLVQKGQLYDRDLNNFSPRISFAWDVGGRGKTIVRGGAGIFYDIFSQDFFTGQIFFNSFNAGPAYNAIGRDPVFFSFSPSVLAPGVPVFDPSTFSSDTTDAASVDPKLRTPYIYNYNLNVQRQILQNTMVQIGYVGSAGHKLFRFRDINQPDQAAINAYDPANGCCVPRPFDTAAPLSSLAPNQPFYVNQLETTANSNYNALQAQLRQQNWRGLTQQISWTWAHSIDTASDGQDFVPNAAQPNDSTHPERERGNSNFDTRHRFVWSLNYNLPRFNMLGKLGEGWQVSSVLTLMSGHPYHLNYNFLDDYDGSGEFFGRPDIVGPVRTNASNPLEFLDLSSFKVPCTFGPGSDGSAASCLPGTRHFGNLGRNSLLGPDYRNFDLALAKDTSLSDRFKLNLRVDFFNLTNHPNFANPYLPAFIADAAPNGLDPVTGRHLGFLPIVATSDVGLGNPILGGGGPRSVQFAARVTF